MMPLPHRLASESLSIGSARDDDELPADRRAAVSELFELHYAPLVRLARFLVDDTESAEDVVMDAFTSLYRRWTAIRDPDQAYGYLRSCVLNGGRSRLRWRRRRREHETDLPLEVHAREDLATRGADRATVLQILRTLPDRQRQVLVLRFYLDLSEAEIAAELRISPGSVKTHASRGIAALAGALDGES